MRLFLPPLEISETAGFSPELDLFGRKHIGDGLKNLVLTIDQPLVVAVDAQWGSGKTTFLKMWAGDLRKSKIPVIYFDAFENDYIDDAFAAIAGQIISLAQEKRKANDTKVKKFTSKALAASKILARSTLRVGVKLGTSGILEANDLKDIAGDISGETSSMIDKHIGEILTKQKEQKATIDEFRNSLSELPDLLSEGQSAEHPTQVAGGEDNIELSKSVPLIIIIDELDRCRPDFALSLLERIKHFFSVDNIHFVLGVHLGQLENSVRYAYGGNIDAKLYLQKFITLPIHLVDRTIPGDQTSADKYCRRIANELEMNFHGIDFYNWLFSRTAFLHDFSFRTLEKIYTILSMSLAFSGANALKPAPLLAGLCVARATRPELYIAAKKGVLKYSEISKHLFLETKLAEHEQFSVESMAEMWKYVTDDSVDDSKNSYYRQMFNQYNIFEKDRILPLIANNVVDRLMPTSN